MNILYLSLNKKETAIGFVTAAIYLSLSIFLEAVLPGEAYWILGITSLVALALVFFPNLRFWKESKINVALTGRQLIWKPLLAVLVCRIICIFIDDILLLYGAPYFVGTDWGPMLWDVRSAMLESSQNGWLMAVALILVMPIVEEFIFRGVIFGTLYPKSSVLAIIVSVALFAAFHTAPYCFRMDDALYLSIYFFQYVPMGLFLIWLYVSTDSIFAPILMHIIMNLMIVF